MFQNRHLNYKIIWCPKKTPKLTLEKFQIKRKTIPGKNSI